MSVILTLQENPTLYYILVTLLGIITGSFLNVIIYRLPIMMEHEWRRQCFDFLKEQAKKYTIDLPKDYLKPFNSIVSQNKFNLVLPRSRCNKCHHAISPLENIPIISYLLLKGKCYKCKTPISPRYPFIELITGLISLIIVINFGLTLQSLCLIYLHISIICLTIIDIDHMILPETITKPLLWSGLLVNLFGVFTSLENAIIGAIAGYMSLWIIYWTYKLLTGKEGMGYGDFTLLSALGAWLGWSFLPSIIIIASISAILITFILKLSNFAFKNKLLIETQIPFGPYLCLGGSINFFLGDTIANYNPFIVHIQ